MSNLNPGDWKFNHYPVTEIDGEEAEHLEDSEGNKIECVIFTFGPAANPGQCRDSAEYQMIHDALTSSGAYFAESTENCFLVPADDEGYVRKCLVDAGFVEDTTMDVGDELYPLPAPNAKKKSGLNAIKSMMGQKTSLNQPQAPTQNISDEDKDNKSTKSLVEMLMEQGISDNRMKCPKCGSEVFLDPNAELGSIDRTNDRAVVYKICSNCMERVIDPELAKLFGVPADDEHDGFFVQDMFDVELPKDDDFGVVAGPYNEAIPDYFARCIVGGKAIECVERDEGESHMLMHIDGGVAVIRFSIPHNKYVDEDGQPVVEWNGYTRFMGIGSVKKKDDKVVFIIETLSEERPAEETNIIAERTSRPPIIKFTGTKFRIMPMADGTTVAQSNAALKTVRVIGCVAIDLHNCISEMQATTPGVEAWFLMECETFSAGTFLIVTDGSGYYKVADKGNGIKEIQSIHDMEVGFGVDDQELIMAAIESITQKDTW